MSSIVVKSNRFLLTDFALHYGQKKKYYAKTSKDLSFREREGGMYFKFFL